MRIILDTMATLSFIGVLSIGIGGAYVYSNRDGIIKEVKRQVTEQVQEAVTGAIPGIDSGIPGASSTPSVPGLPF